VKQEIVAKDIKKFTFAFNCSESIYCLPAGQHIIIRAKNASGEFISRAYTPINQIGSKG